MGGGTGPTGYKFTEKVDLKLAIKLYNEDKKLAIKIYS